MKKTMTTEQVADRLARRPCTCCSVFHNPNLCSQCQVAGCGANKKNEKCRLQGSLLANMQKSEFQLQSELIEKDKQNADLLKEIERLRQLVAHYEKTNVDTFLDLNAASAENGKGKISREVPA